jgi:hypothetical protein
MIYWLKKLSKDWDLQEWQAFRRKSTVKKDETGYYITTRIEFYCPNCLKS